MLPLPDLRIAGKLVPCSDMAGEVIAVGEDVDQWKIGDRVCSNFSPGHLHGDPNEATSATSLGGQAPGVLTEYRSFPSQVSSSSNRFDIDV